MSTNYMDDNWSEISRDERFFCAELYQIIKQNKRPFNKLLVEKGIIESVHTEYEIGYEVCFYRDYICKYGYKENHSINTIKDENDKLIFPHKRTFDLCLFLENEIIIIEAKAQQGFDTDQLEEFKKDRSRLKDLLNLENMHIKIIGLYSSKYSPSPSTLNYFKNKDVKEGFLTWNEIYEIYPKPFKTLKRADDCFVAKCPDKKSDTD